MGVLASLGLVFAAGCVGGLVNAWMTDNGFALPDRVANGAVHIVRPGFLGNMLVGGVAAGVSWGLYGPLAAVHIIGNPAAGALEAAVESGVTLAGLVGGVLVGVGGARWLTGEVDKRLLTAAAAQAALHPASARVAAAIATSSPAGALEMASTRLHPADEPGLGFHPQL